MFDGYSSWLVFLKNREKSSVFSEAVTISAVWEILEVMVDELRLKKVSFTKNFLIILPPTHINNSIQASLKPIHSDLLKCQLLALLKGFLVVHWDKKRFRN